MRWILLSLLLGILSVGTVSAVCIPTGQEVINNYVDENCDGWIDRTEFSIRGEHPRLFITSENLPELKDRATTTNHDTYAFLKDWCDENWDDLADQQYWGLSEYDYGMLRYALIYQLGEISGETYAHPIEEYADQAINIIMDSVTPSSAYPNGRTDRIADIAIAYDWVYERMDDAQRQAVVDMFRARCGTAPSLPERPIGYRYSGTPCSFYPGLAFYGDGIDDPLAETYVDFIQAHLDDARAISHSSGEDGGYIGGFSYARAYGGNWISNLERDFSALATATSMEDEDTFEKYPYQGGYPIWYLYGVMPGPISGTPYPSNDVVTVTKFEDIYYAGWNIEKTENELMLIFMSTAKRFKDSGDLEKAQVITWLLQDRLQVTKVDSTWDIIFNDRTITPRDPDSLGVPPVKAFGWDESRGEIDSYMGNPKAGLGQVFMKSSWSPDEDTTHAVFKAFPYMYFGHQHYDTLTFGIFKGEPLVIPNAGYYFYWYEGSYIDYTGGTVGFPHYWYYFQRSPATNSPLIMDPDENIDLGTASHYPNKINDGGERALPLWVGGVWGQVTEGSSRDFGGLVRYEDHADYTYSSGDATKAYNSIVDGQTYLSPGCSPKVDLVRRDFIYLKGDREYFVIFDRINSIDPSFKKIFQLHTVGEPEFDGQTEIVYGDSQGGVFTSDDTDSILVTQDKAKLFIKTLLPKETKLYKAGGKTTATLQQPLDDSVGTVLGGGKIDIAVSSTADFPDKPVVVIDGLSGTTKGKEAFMCDGKTDTHLTGCIRGLRYFKSNFPLNHSTGNLVTMDYSFMVRKADTGDWISYPVWYGTPYNFFGGLGVPDYPDLGRWTLYSDTYEEEYLSNFLNILQPTVDMTQTQMAITELIESSDGYMSGTIIRETGPRIIMFSNSGEPKDYVKYDAPYAGIGRHLIVDLMEGEYDIYKDSQLIDTLPTSSQGTLYFEEGSGGTFEILYEGGIPRYCGDSTCDPGESYSDCPVDCFHDADKNEDGQLSVQEISDYVQAWKEGQVSMADLMVGIRIWKAQ